ncbi:uncharacterized protein PAC_14637 [Phialocephala subalpina]|uniref:CHAT domain-containing protein n=1 Tax=Phialocephala subalpina TaxID=576137 RepID=A0A1L7XI95_9HELO|nr:uncharacterized protein PAC_14637 [Phialocephala subalpina]
MSRDNSEGGFFADLSAASEIGDMAVDLSETGDLSDLNTAIDMVQQVIDIAYAHGVYPTQQVINIMGMLSKRYQHTHNGADVELGISNGNTALRTMSPIDPGRRSLLINLGTLHCMRYDNRGTTEDFDQAITYVTTALSMSPWDFPLRHDLQYSLGTWFLDRYHMTQDATYLDRSVQAHEAALRLIPAGHPQLASRMATLAISLRERFERTDDINTLTRSIIVMEEAIRITPHNDPDRPLRLVQFGICLGKRFERIGNTTDLEEAIRLSEQAERLAGVGHGDRATILNQLGGWLGRRYENTRSVPDNERAIAVGNEALLLSPDDPRVMHNLGNALRLRFVNSSARADLDDSIKLDARSRELLPAGSPEIVSALFSRAKGLIERFRLVGYIGDLEDAITSSKEAVEIMPKNRLERFNIMMELAVSLKLRFEHSGRKSHSGSTEDLDDAISLGEQVLREAPRDYPERADWLGAHGNALGARFETMGDAKDLEEAIRLTGEAVAIDPRNDHSVADKLSDYGFWLGQRFEQTGNTHDLNKAIELTDKAVKAVFITDTDKARLQTNLGRWLARRFERVGALGDLNQAIEVTKLGVDLTPKKNIDRPARLNGLSNWYNLRYNRENRIDDLNKSIDNLLAALDETPGGHPWGPLFMLSLADRLHTRGLTGGGGRKDDLDEAVQQFEEALKLLPENHYPHRLSAFNNLANTLRGRFIHFGRNSNSTDDIDRSIKMLTEVISTMDVKHSLRAGVLFNLGTSYQARFDHAGNPLPTDQEAALRSFMDCFRRPNFAPSYRIEGARRAAIILESLLRSQEAVELLKEAIDLFPVLSPRSLSRSDQQEVLGQIAGIASMAAAIALKSGTSYYSVLTLLERGRGIIASLLMETRMDLSMLDSEAASEFLKAREKLDALHLAAVHSAADLTSPDMDDEVSRSYWVSNSQSRYAAEEELQAIIKKIQADPKTQGFLGPPSKDELMEVIGDDTIVVISAASYRCDAFVIDSQYGVRLVELTRLKLEDIDTWVKRLRSSRPFIDLTMLEWLWDDIAGPILEKLGFNRSPPDRNLPRIFWILTGPLSHLPIHAAGWHAKRSTETVMDRVMSSYSSSLRSLVHGKKTNLRNLGKASDQKALLIGMGKTPGGSGLADLPFAVKEVERLEKLCSLLNLDPIRLSCQSREAVLAQLAGCILFHFAGHGHSDPLDPSHSGLLLEDGLLTVADFQFHKMGEQAPFLGFLSACLTGANDVDRLVDEGIHLISACQLAGFRHVIGALWQVFDDSSVEVAESVYEGIAEREMTDRSVCAGLHSALVRLRDAWIAERSSITSDVARLPTTNAVELTVLDSEVEETAGEGKDGERDGRLQLRKAPAVALVRADWIPYVHYGQ